MILQNFATVDKFRTLQLNVCKNAGTPSMPQWSTRTTRLTSTTKSSKSWTTFILNPRLKKKRHRESETENEKRNQLSLSGWTTLVQTKEEWKKEKKMNKWAYFLRKLRLNCTISSICTQLNNVLATWVRIYIDWVIFQLRILLLKTFNLNQQGEREKTKLVQICVLVSLSERCMVVFWSTCHGGWAPRYETIVSNLWIFQHK